MIFQNLCTSNDRNRCWVACFTKKEANRWSHSHKILKRRDRRQVEQMYNFPSAQTKEMFELALFVLQNRMTCHRMGTGLFNGSGRLLILLAVAFSRYLCSSNHFPDMTKIITPVINHINQCQEINRPEISFLFQLRFSVSIYRDIECGHLISRMPRDLPSYDFTKFCLFIF
jgi:hypothetical protein